MKLSEELRNKKSRDNRALLDRAADRIDELEAKCHKQNEGEWKMLIYNEHCSCGKSRKVSRYECSVCKRIADMQPYGLNFCPNCGAKMKGGE